MDLLNQIPNDLRKLLAFGSGVGVEIGAGQLEIVVTRVRPAGVLVRGRLLIQNYTERPAAEWGAEYGRFLQSLGVAHLGATVLLPREEVIVRQIALPGVPTKDLDGAIRLQLDALHPYGEDEVVSGWSPLEGGAVLVGIVRRAALDRYLQLFAEAGVALASFTFSAAAVRSAVRLSGAVAKGGFLALSRRESGAVEVYGESPARPLFSAEFDLPPERAAALAAGELRLPPDTIPLRLVDVLPKPTSNPVENDLSRNALPYAAALAGACPRLAPSANLLPAEHRRSTARAMLAPTLALAGLVALTAGGMAAYSALEQHRYVQKLDAEIAQLEPLARRAAAIDQQTDRIRARARLLDDMRSHTRNDMDALNELTRLLEAPAWTNSIDLMRDSARIAGEAGQAAPILKIIDSSPLFENSEFVLIARSGASEQFQIRTTRESRK